MPELDASRLEPAIQQQLQQSRASLLALASRSDPPRPELAEAFGRMGMLCHAYDLLVPAEAFYHNAQSLAPEQSRWPYYLGQLYRKRGETELSARSYEQAIEIEPSYVPSLVGLGDVELERNRPDEAEKLYRKALAIDGACAAALAGLGRTELSRERFAEAAANLEGAIAAQPAALAIHYYLGMAYRGLGDLAKAQAHLSQHRAGAAPQLPDPLRDELVKLRLGAQTHERAAGAALRSGRLSKAIEEFQEGVRTSPRDPVLRRALGAALLKSGDLRGAAEQLSTAVKLAPSDDVSRLFLGMVLALQRDDVAALREFRESLRLNPDSVNARLSLAGALQREGSQAEALRHYEEILQREPGNVFARSGAVFALVRLERYAEARRRLEEDIVLFPDRSVFANALARLLAACPQQAVRDGERALKVARKIFEANRSARAAETLAMALAETGRFEEAAEAQRLVIAEAAKTGQRDLVRRMQANLSLYQARRPCRVPWQPDDAVFSPPPVELGES